MTVAAPAAARPRPHLLVVEDDAPIRAMLQATLEAEGYQVTAVATAREGEACAGSRRIDLFVVDLGLPDGDGLALIRRLRGWTQRPVVVVSARSQEAQKVEALDAGADDYLVKPFGVAELHARLRVALRHAAQTSLAGRSLLRLGATSVDLAAREVLRAGEPVQLTALQWRLLEVLARQPGRVLTSRHLLHEVWGPQHAEQAHYLRIYVRQLRQKLEADAAQPRYLLTETGTGYRLLVDPAE